MNVVMSGAFWKWLCQVQRHASLELTLWSQRNNVSVAQQRTHLLLNSYELLAQSTDTEW